MLWNGHAPRCRTGRRARWGRPRILGGSKKRRHGRIESDLGRSRTGSLESGSGLLSLDARESLELVLRHRDLCSALESVDLSGEEVGSVRVERLVSGSSSRESLSMLVDKSGGDGSSLSLLEVGNDGLLEGKLDKIQGEVPDNVPDPDDTDPSTRDTSDKGEAPVSVSGNDGRDELSKTEGTHERVRWSLHP